MMEPDPQASMSSPWAVGALKPKAVERQTPEELSQLARDIVSGKVFTDRHVHRNEDIGSIFMVIMLGAFQNQTQEYLQDIGMLFEYLSQAGPMSVNGYPTFFSVRHIGRADAAIVWEKVEKLQKMMEEI